MNHRRTHTAILAITAALLLSPFPSLTAQDQPVPLIELGAPFRDNAVLQRGMDVPVWGWSKPGTAITVELAGQKQSAMAGANGKWMLELKPLTASADPAEMVVREAANQVVIKNILVGEVWMASGQSNMQWIATRCDVNQLVADLKAKGESPPIREFQVAGAYSALHPIERATGAWTDGDYGNYSAVAFAFAHKLYGELKVPIGILNCSWSQTAIESWIPRVGYVTAEDDYGNKLVTSKNWPGGKIVIANEKTDTSTEGKVYEYRKMPLLSQQFDDNAVLQAGKPVTIWGSTRNYGEWQSEPEKGDCKVEFEFGDIKKNHRRHPGHDGVAGDPASHEGGHHALHPEGALHHQWRNGASARSKEHGVVFLCGNKMIAYAQGADFGPEMSALANCFKSRFGGDDVPFFYTIPASSLAPKITKPQAIKSASTAMEITEWSAAKPGGNPNDKAELDAASQRIAALLDQVVKEAAAENR